MNGIGGAVFFYLILYIVIAEGIAWIGTGYFKLLLIILAVPESLNEDILDPRLYRLGRALLRFPKWLLNLTDSMLRKLFRWLGKEMKESEKSILVLNYERRVLRVEDDDTRQFAALICTGFSLLLICGLFVHFLFLWVELLIILCFYLLPFVFNLSRLVIYVNFRQHLKSMTFHHPTAPFSLKSLLSDSLLKLQNSPAASPITDNICLCAPAILHGFPVLQLFHDP